MGKDKEHKLELANIGGPFSSNHAAVTDVELVKPLIGVNSKSLIYARRWNIFYST